MAQTVASQNTLVEAGAGFGKSELVALLASRFNFTVAATAVDVTDCLSDSEPVVIDAIEHWSPTSLAALNKVIQDSPAKRWVVVGRHIRALPATSGWNLLDGDDLCLDASQIAGLLIEHGIDAPNLADAVEQLSGGWPIVVDTIARQMASASEASAVARDLGRHNSVVQSLVDQLMGPSSSDSSPAATLATLPFFDDTVADLLAPSGLVNRLTMAGIPLRRQSDGQITFVEPVRTVLQARANRQELPTKVVDYLVATHRLHAALDTCIAFGDRTHAAKILAEFDRQQEAHLDPKRLHRTVASLGSVIESYPRALYVHAHVSAVHRHVEESKEAIEKAATIFTKKDPGLTQSGHVETLITLGVWRVFDGQLAEANAIVDQTSSKLGSDTRLQAMHHDLTGLLHHGLATDDDLEIATEELHAAYDLWRQLNEPEAATVTLFRLAAGVLASRGRRSEALTLIDDLPDLGPMSLHTKARHGLERALLLPYLGRADEVDDVLVETKRISQLLEDGWTYALSLVAEVVAASILDEGDKVSDVSHRLLDEGHFTVETVSEGWYWIHVAEALARCERWPEARKAMSSATEVPGMPEWMILYGRASIEARCGNPEQALELLGDLELRDDVEMDKRWQLRLFEAFAQHRAGRTDQAAKLLDTANEAAAALGTPGLPEILERRLVQAISNESAVQSSEAALNVRVFGTLSVEQDGKPLTVPAGNVATLLKLLACAGDLLTVDKAIDAIWPETSLTVGRRRLRNVVARLRDTFGQVVERNGDLIGLNQAVVCDYARAAEAAKNSLKDRSVSLGELTRSLDDLDQPLLVDEPYQDWADAVREEQRDLIVGLLDRLGTMASDPAMALHYLNRANELDLTTSSARSQRIRSLTGELG